MTKTRNAGSVKLGAAGKSTAVHSPIRMLNVPGFQALEDKLLIYSSLHGEVPPEVEKVACELSIKTFGVTHEDIEFEIPDEYWDYDVSSPECARIEKDYEEYESRFETTDISDEEVAEVLKRLGLDFYDDRGFPLRCTRWFSRQAEAAAKGIKGRMPDQDSADLERWARSMADAANSWPRRNKAKW
ncbi:MAG: hypothetical protein WCF20_02745 [Methylovirgula sp.]